VTTDAAGNVFFADQYNNRIRKITPGGIISTVAGSGAKGFAGDNGSATSAALYWPNNVKVDNAGNIFIGDRRNNRVRKVSGGIIKTVAGNGGQTASGDGGSATLAAVDASAIALDSAGNIFIADTQNERIRRVNTKGIISTLVSKVRTPTGLSTNATGDVFTCEYDNHRIQKVSLAGVILSRSNESQIISALPSSPVKFSVYPNPVQNTLYIQTPETGTLRQVELLDVAGKVLLAQKINRAQSFTTLQLNRLASGTYFIRTTGNDNTITVKEIVKD
jgi:sugar lactone lactonase YvrE